MIDRVRGSRNGGKFGSGRRVAAAAVLAAAAAAGSPLRAQDAAAADTETGKTGGVAAEAEAAAPQKEVFDAVRFGVPIQIQLYASRPAAAKNAAEEAFAEARRLDRIFSDYHPDSEARRLVAAPGGRVAVSPELYELLLFAEAAREETDGALDVRVGPLTHLWRKARRFRTRPADGDLDEARRAAGEDAFRLRTSGLISSPVGTVDVLRPGVRLDFGAVAKGYAVDRMCRIIERDGVEAWLVDAGGDIRVGGRRPDKRRWTIEVESTGGEDPVIVDLSRTAIATSGDSQQHVVIEGRRYSHIIDPRSGTPLTSQPQVTVVAETAAAADALASALSVMGSGRGLKWLDNYRRSGRDTFGRLIAVRFEEDGRGIAGPMWSRLFRDRGEPSDDGAAETDARLATPAAANDASADDPEQAE